MEEVRPLVGEKCACPFDTSGGIKLNSDDLIANHYLELLLGRGPKDLCPQAQKYLEGIALEMPLSQQPYQATILKAKNGFKDEDNVMSVVMRLDQKAQHRDFQ